MIFYPVVLECAKCSNYFPASRSAFNAVGDLRFEGTCPNCHWENSWETTYDRLIYACQKYELTHAEKKAAALANDPTVLAEMIVTTRPC